ncbi:MAG: radical SAM family heme chaperone HemW [Acidimicrobiales bacterium]
MGEYAAACRTEILGAGLAPATSVFFGGGTPSLLPGELLTSVLEAVPRVGGAEVTVECNPETVTEALVGEYRRAGVNRLSFGVQSMVPHVLEGLGREHDPASVSRAVGRARAAGFDNISLDLIYGGAGESDGDWAATLDAALALEPAHLSAYALTVEPGTPLAADPTRHPDDDVQADRYLRAEAVLRAAGFANYEISNWARPGRECRHNLLYWRQGDYRGIGCAAHSHRRGRRWWNVRTPERYIAAVAAGEGVEAGAEVLDAAAQERERLRLALRTRAGVETDAFSDDDLALLSERGLIEVGAGKVVLTAPGRLLANQVAMRLRDRGEDDAHAGVQEVGVGRIREAGVVGPDDRLPVGRDFVV